ncbi:MAG: type II secretion system protein GspJ [Pseudohongiella sp.]|uniref:type II secretion system protein GspJ n=1 Tax=Pseudohongiella sp. TaxID=1979412 RepID=UPI0034A0849D
MIAPVAQRGFTLIELLIAMALTVLIGAMSYRFLDTAMAVSEQGEEALQQINELERVWLLLAADLEQASSRSAARPATGVDALAATDYLPQGRPAMLSQSGAGVSLPATLQRPGAMLWFVRAGWSNPLQQQRSELQRVAYRLDDGSLYRDFWPERNQSLTEAAAGSLLLLQDVEALSFRFLPIGSTPVEDAWLSEWPPVIPAGEDSEAATGGDELASRLPAAVEVRLLSAALGEVRRIFLLPGAS